MGAAQRGLGVGVALAALTVAGLAIPATADASPVRTSSPSSPGRTGNPGNPGSSPGAGSTRPAQARLTPEATATQRARSTGHTVAVDALTTPTSQVSANPDGSFTLRATVQPVRAKQNGRWVPIDPTLERTGATVRPTAAATPVTFSPGGTAPLATIDAGGGRFTLTWPGRLPAPTLDGTTATYANVRPGIDLRLTANPAGYAEALVVKNRAAAARIDTIRFGIHADGLTVKADAKGGFDVVDHTGQPVLSSPAAQAWDSSRQRRTAPVATRLAKDAVTITPDRAWLDDPATTYPVIIDPDTNPGRQGWTKMFSGHPSQGYWNGNGDDGDGKVGYCGWPYCNGIGVARTAYQFDIRWLHDAGAIVSSAEFNALETYAPSCQARGVSLYQVGAIDGNTTWNSGLWWGPSFGSRNVAYGYSTSCGPAPIGWDVGPFVKGLVDNGNQTATFGLRADNESDAYAWKKFSTDANSTYLVVHYNRPPGTPYNLDSDGHGCGTGASGLATASISPTLRAVADDPDGNNLTYHFQWTAQGQPGQVIGDYTTPAAVASGVPTSTGSGALRLQNGQAISWQAQVTDSAGTPSPWSAWCDITVDTTPPAHAPGVSSALYPPTSTNQAGGSVGLTGTFTFNGGGDPDVAGFVYDNCINICEPQTYVAAATPGGPAAVQITPSSPRPQYVVVKAVDRAGNRGPAYNYNFLVNPGSPPIAYWPLDGYGGSTAVPETVSHHDGTLAGVPGHASRGPGRFGDDVGLDGTSNAYVNTNGGPAVDTSQSFSVSAWAKLLTVGGYPAIVSEDSNRSPGFQLQATPDGHWAFAMFSQDVDGGGPQNDRAIANLAIRVGSWTNVVGTYDAAAHLLRVYVDGRLVATTPHTSTWAATGAVSIGRSMWMGNPSDFFPGYIDDVKIYNRVLQQSELADPINNPAVQTAWYPMDDQGTTASDVSGNLNSAVQHGNVSWGTGVNGSGAAKFNGTSGYLATARPVVATDNSFSVSARVLLTAADKTKQTAVAEEGNAESAFVLQYRGDIGKWSFAISHADDRNGPSWDGVNSTTTGQAGQWTNLTGVYDAPNNELRLYVNGALEGSSPLIAPTWNATGPLDIGRAYDLGGPVQYFNGSIDDVHVNEGVLTEQQIKDASGTVPPTPSSVYAGELSRWISSDGSVHLTTSSGLVPNGYHYEGPFGLPAPAGAPDTRMLYSCLLGPSDEFTSVDPGCEGQQLLGTLGRVYQNSDDAPGLVGLYACQEGPSGTHFDARVSDCEGYQVRGLLGYTRDAAYLIRSRNPYTGEHWTQIQRVDVGYVPEGSLGIVELEPTVGTGALQGCTTTGGDHFLSTASDCGGSQVLGWTGYTWPAPPPDHPSQRIYECAVLGSGERFESADRDCEGHTVIGPLTYTVISL